MLETTTHIMISPCFISVYLQMDPKNSVIKDSTKYIFCFVGNKISPISIFTARNLPTFSSEIFTEKNLFHEILEFRVILSWHRRVDRLHMSGVPHSSVTGLKTNFFETFIRKLFEEGI